ARWLQVAASGLFQLDRLEERLEVADAEAARAAPLDDLEEQRGPILHRPRKRLQQIAVLVAVDEDAQLADHVEILADLADPFAQVGVVSVRHAEKADAPRLHGAY